MWNSNFWFSTIKRKGMTVPKSQMCVFPPNQSVGLQALLLLLSWFKMISDFKVISFKHEQPNPIHAKVPHAPTNWRIVHRWCKSNPKHCRGDSRWCRCKQLLSTSIHKIEFSHCLAFHFLFRCWNAITSAADRRLLNHKAGNATSPKDLESGVNELSKNQDTFLDIHGTNGSGKRQEPQVTFLLQHVCKCELTGHCKLVTFVVHQKCKTLRNPMTVVFPLATLRVELHQKFLLWELWWWKLGVWLFFWCVVGAFQRGICWVVPINWQNQSIALNAGIDIALEHLKWNEHCCKPCWSAFLCVSRPKSESFVPFVWLQFDLSPQLKRSKEGQTLTNCEKNSCAKVELRWGVFFHVVIKLSDEIHSIWSQFSMVFWKFVLNQIWGLQLTVHSALHLRAAFGLMP